MSAHVDGTQVREPLRNTFSEEDEEEVIASEVNTSGTTHGPIFEGGVRSHSGRCHECFVSDSLDEIPLSSHTLLPNIEWVTSEKGIHRVCLKYGLR